MNDGNDGSVRYSVCGLGNPLLDHVGSGEEALLTALGAPKGSMNLVQREQAETVVALLRGAVRVPGGSCANTLRALAWLASSVEMPPAVYCGAVGDDRWGKEYRRALEGLGVHTRLAVKSAPTGCSMIVVTPDFERTMFTYLGACREYTAGDLDLPAIRRSRFFHVTGYMWDTENQKQAVRQAIECAGHAGVSVSFDLADPFVVQRYHAEFLEWLPGRVQLLFGNRDEYRLLFGAELADAQLLARAAEVADTAVMKAGAEGCWVIEEGRPVRVQAFPVAPVDTTAAGDCFAGGFLYGCLRGLGHLPAARLANRLAAEIVTVTGCDLGRIDTRRVLPEAK